MDALQDGQCQPQLDVHGRREDRLREHRQGGLRQADGESRVQGGRGQDRQSQLQTTQGLREGLRTGEHHERLPRDTGGGQGGVLQRIHHQEEAAQQDCKFYDIPSHV